LPEVTAVVIHLRRQKREVIEKETSKREGKRIVVLLKGNDVSAHPYHKGNHDMLSF